MKNKRILLGAVALVAAIVLLITGICINLNRKTGSVSISTPELAKAMTYEQFAEGDEAVESTDNVKFSAFFLRDLDGDGYAEKIKGTCRPIGEEDTLYMEINVQTEGYLKNAKIEIAGKNFYLQTSLLKDEQIKDNYVGNNIKEIEFNQINSGTQKLLTGIIKYAESNNIKNYSREDNKIILTGTYVGSNGEETEVRKEIELTVDWYGRTETTITNTTQLKYNLDSRIDVEEGTIKLGFEVTTKEVKQELLLSKNQVKGIIPEIEGYQPLEVRMINTETENLEFTYDEITRTFIIERRATVREDGVVTTAVERSNIYEIEVKYPIEAYRSVGEDTVSIKIPIETYYEGYNNPNTEFNNPYRSNIARKTITSDFTNIVLNIENEGNIEGETGGNTEYIRPVYLPMFKVTVGRTIYKPSTRNIISKEKALKIYNEVSEKETNDTYTVRWYAYTGTNGKTTGLVMKETKEGQAQVVDQFIKTDSTEVSMEEITSNIGIYFTGAGNLLKEDGWIKVYDEETGNLLVTFTKDNWNKYTPTNPYKYEMPVKHIRIETSETNKESSIYVYNIKELDNEYITGNFTKEEFDNLQYIESTLNGYLGGQHIATKTHKANYENPFSIATIALSKDTISTQATEENVKITINAIKAEANNQLGWKDGSFLVKIPKEILEVEINDVTIDNSNVLVTTYEIIENEEGQAIKINTENVNNIEQAYQITIDLDITPDPRKVSSSGEIELYASNKEIIEYYYKGKDKYDVNDNLNTEEIVNKTQVKINVISPGSLLTSQTASEYNTNNMVIVAPKIAEITPRYGQENNEKQTAKIGIQIKNNYISTISEVVILGKIPFEGNTTALSNINLNSQFTTKMVEAGIEIPEELVGKVKIYYSEKENPDRDVEKEENGWKTAENISNWENIKTFLIDFEEEILSKGEENTFYYKVEIPEGVEINKTTYSHYGIYFSLDTEEGKYRTQTEPNKLGLRIVEKFNLELIKTQKATDKKVTGATYAVTEILEDDTNGTVRTGTTNKNGILTINNLYAEKTYEIKEIKSPNDYELNSDIIRFTSHVLEDGTLTIEKTQGSTKEEITVTKNEGEKHKVTVQVEDEVKAKLKITQKEQGTGNTISYVKYKLTGYGMPSNGRILTTNIDGEISINGLKIGEEYTLEETKATGYYLADPITFKIVNNEGIYEIQITSGTVLENILTEEESLPIANLTLENEKIPTYTLEISKVKKELETELTEEETRENTTTEKQVTYLEGAKFKLYKDEKVIGEYTTDENGKITIENLYQYIEGKAEEATYTLKEVLAPVGYAKVKDITFKVENTDGVLQLINQEGNEEKYTVEGTIIKLTIEDSPSFRLIKKDGETGEVIANVKFAIYNVDKGAVPARNSKGEVIGTLETINGREYYTVKTDENGTLTIDLPEGYYKAVELEAPEKYNIEDKEYYFGIGASREGKKTYQAKFAEETYIVEDISSTKDKGYIVATSKNLTKYSEDDDIEWDTKIGKNAEGYINSVRELKDGGYIVGGYFQSSTIDLGNGVTLSRHSTSYADGMIIKYSKNGEVEWAKAIGGEGYDTINSVEATRDGGYIVGGTFKSSIDLGNGTTLINTLDPTWQPTDGMIIKYTAEGVVEWAHTMENEDGNVIEISQISDGGYIVTNRNGTTNSRIKKYNESGEKEWESKISAEISTVVATHDGGFIIGGSFYGATLELGNGIILTNKYERLNNTYYEEGLLIKYSANGEVEWAQSINGTYYSHENIKTISETRDGGYIVGGYFYSKTIELGNGVTLSNNYASTSYADGMIIKYNEEGIAQWAKAIGGKESANDSIYSVEETRDGGYIVGGSFYSETIELGNGVSLSKDSTGYSNGMLIKYELKEEINIMATEAYEIGGEASEVINSVQETSDGGYIVGGTFTSEKINLGNGVILTNNGSNDGMVIKYNEKREVEWASVIGGTSNDSIKSVIETKDGGHIIGGQFTSETIELGNGVILTNRSLYSSNSDGMLIKYNKEGEVEWACTISGINDERINAVSQTQDGGYIVGGDFSSKTIELGNGLTLTRKGNSDGIIIKYNEEGIIEWAQVIGGSDNDSIGSVSKTEDGGYIIGGQFTSETIELGNGVILTNRSLYSGYSDGMLIKYNKEGEAEWAHGISGRFGDSITSVAETQDGGYIVIGNFSQSTNLGNLITLPEACNGVLIRYSPNLKAQWIYKMCEKQYLYINSVSETKNKNFIIGGYFTGETIDLSKGIRLTNNSSSNNGFDGVIIEISDQRGVPEVQELIVENKRKDFKITTSINEIDGIKGGSISGEEESCYEKVKYGDSSNKEIIMTPDENYEIISIKINGQDHIFKANEDGSYTMPRLTNITENKHIEVTYILKDNKIIINNVDSQTKEKLEGATFKLDQIEEREVSESVIGDIVDNGQQYIETDLEQEVTDVFGELTNNGQEYEELDIENEVINVLGELTDNGAEYTVPDLEKEVTDVLGELTNNGTYYFVEQEGKYAPTNSKTYQVENGETEGKPNTTANSYIEIDLTNKEGEYVVVVNANISSESYYDYGYATITESTTAPAYDSSTGRFIELSGTVNAQDYTSMMLNGGNKYYLHLGYKKDSSGDIGTDQIIFNNIKIYEITSITYNFVENNGKYEPNNQGNYHSTVANSYMAIDLTNKEGKYGLIVNANISSQVGDYGYATITESTTAPAYNSSTGRFIYLTGTVNAQDYQPTLLEGGKVYYLHLGYYKNASIDSVEDKFSINSIKLYETKEVTYGFIHNDGKYESTISGKDDKTANSYIPIDLRNKEGKYDLIVNANISSESGDYGYATITESTTAPAYNSSTGRFIYLTGTVNAQDYKATLLEGGKVYYLHLGYYKNASINSGEDKFSINSIKLYETKEVTYGFIYNDGKYESTISGKDNKTANSYIPIDLRNQEGTYNLIVNANISSQSGDHGYATITESTTAPVYNSSKGRLIYLTGTVEPTDYATILEGEKLYYLHLGYQKNASGSLGEDKFTVNSITITPNEDDLYHTEITTNSEGQAITQIPFGKYAVTETVAPEGYELNENSVVIEFREDGTYEFTIENNKLPKVIVHHYLKGTTTKVSEDEILQDKTGYPYKALPKMDIDRYELEKGEDGNYIIPDNATGQFKLGEQEVIYYYEGKMVTLTVNHFIEGTEKPVELEDGSLAESIITTGNIGEEYITNALENVAEKYELVEEPSNAKGIYGEEVEIVTYYYRIKVYKITTRVEEKEETTITGETRIVKGGTISGEGEHTYEVVQYGEKSAKEVVITPDDLFKVSKITINGIQQKFIENGDRSVTLQTIENIKENKEVVVTFERIPTKIIVHHFIEGTENRVPLSNGEKAEDEVYEMMYGSNYETLSILPTELDEHYELASIPNNAEGIVGEEEITVIYYYKIKTHNIITKVEEQTEVNLEGETVQVKGGTISGEGETPYEIVNHGENSTKEIVITPDNLYKVSKITINGIEQEFIENEDRSVTLQTIENIKENKEVVVTFERIPTKIIVHHFIEGTENRVPLLNGEKAEDEVYEREYREKYTTKSISKDELDEYYELESIPSNAEGIVLDETIIVTYYYRVKEYSLELTKYQKETDRILEGITFKIRNSLTEEEREYTTKANGKILVGELTLGQSYEIQETSTIEGFVLKEEKIVFTTDIVDGKLTIKVLEGSFKEKAEEIVIEKASGENPIIKVSLENEPIFTLIKKGDKGEQLLPGAKFEIKELVEENGETIEKDAKDIFGNIVGTEEEINGEILRIVITNEKGEISEALKSGKYKITEVQAPENYGIGEQNTYYFEVHKNQPELHSMEKVNTWEVAEEDWEMPLFETESNIVGLKDGGYIGIAMITESITIPAEKTANNEEVLIEAVGSDGIIIKYNTEKKIEAIKKIGSTSEDGITGIKYTSDGGFIVCGAVTGETNIQDGEVVVNLTDENAQMSAIAIKYDKDMKAQWISKMNEGISVDYRGIETSDGSFVIYGYGEGCKTLAENTINNEVIELGEESPWYIKKLRRDGKVEWAIRIDQNYDPQLTAIKELDNGNYIISNIMNVGLYSEISSANGLIIKEENLIEQMGGFLEEIVETIPPTYLDIGMDGKLILTGYLCEDNTIIRGEYTSNGEDIKLDLHGNDMNGVVIKFDENIKVEEVHILNGMSVLAQVITQPNGEYIVNGQYMGELTIPAEETVKNEEIIVQSGDEVRELIIKYNSQGKIEYANGEERTVGLLMQILEDEYIIYGEEEQIIFKENSQEGTKAEKVKLEIVNTYNGPESEIENIVEQVGPEKITSKDEKVHYELKYNGTINYFTGNARLTLVDRLPYPIIVEESEIAGGIYNAEERTITWIEEIKDIDTSKLGEAKNIVTTKTLNLKYDYGNINEIRDKIENKVISKIELLEISEENPEEYVIVKEETQEAILETLIEMSTKIKVHHYIYDAKTGEYTEVRLTEDEIIEGIIGQEYETRPSEKVSKNYSPVSTTPENYRGKMTEEIIEVNYYYELITPIVENAVEKTVTATKDNNGVATLTKEDGIVIYNIKYNTIIKDYIGKATIEIVDTLPEYIDITKSDLAGGRYDEATKTITWTEKVEGIDTFANGEYTKEITKEIKVVYNNQNVLEDLVNTVTGTTKVYYPENYPTSPEEEQVTKIIRDEAIVKQEYKVNLKIEKVWEDNENLKGKRPESVKIEVNGIQNEETREIVLSAENGWSCEITNLPKYDANGNKIIYEVMERETNQGDLEYYEAPVITHNETQTEETTNYLFTVKNAYRLLNTDLKAEITKEGSQEITSSSEEVEYTINFKAEIKDYIGGKVKIVDTLPYKIDVDKSNLANGIYDDQRQTITWEEELPHINTDVLGESYEVDITKQIKVVYKDIDLRLEKMTNKVNGEVELYDTEEREEREATHDTNINVNGKVIVRYVDRDTGRDIDTNYNYEITEKVGNRYTTEAREIENYEYIESSNNETGIIVEGTQEVIYYYTRIKTTVLVKYQDREGNELSTDVLIEGQVGDAYRTEAKEIENYRFVEVTENVEGIMTKEQIIVIYVYEKIPAKVIVKHLEKVIIEVEGEEEAKVEEKEILPEEIIEGYVGDNYTTERKVIVNYKAAEPEPENKTGKMTEEPIEVKYYYEKVPSGIITVKYVDIETEEEIKYKETKEDGTEEKTYRYEIKGYVGEEYETELKEIPYYIFVNSTENTKGKLTENSDAVIYYYRKLSFNFSVEKTITGVILNEEILKVSNNKLLKVEVKTAEVGETNLIVSYSIKVRNDGELKGKAKIVERIPAGYEIVENAGYWKEESGVLITEVELEVGEEKELIVKLRWINSENNLGTGINTAEIKEAENEVGYKELTEADNQSIATVLVTIKTGETINNIVKVLLIPSLALCLFMEILLVIFIKKRPYIKEIKFLKKK